MARDAALQEAGQRAKAAGPDDDGVESAILGDALDRGRGIADRLEELGLMPRSARMRLASASASAWTRSSSQGSIGARPGWNGTTLTTLISAS